MATFTKPLRAYVIHPHRGGFEVEINGLESMQALVGGWLEGLVLANDEDNEAGYVAYGNDEAKLIGMPVNLHAQPFILLRPDDFLCGPVLFSRVDREGGTIALADGWMPRMREPKP